MTIERYAAIKGSFMQNTFAHTNDHWTLPELPADEKPRTPASRSKIYAASMHFIAAHIRHPENLSAANARVEFEYVAKTGLTPKIRVVALTDIAEGQELTLVHYGSESSSVIDGECDEIHCDR